jgi:DNA-binding winged helix-turn-helix (wHTH) protein
MRMGFADFVLDTGTRELRKGGAPVRLSPKAFDLLAVLAESRPQAISKEMLIERVWPGTYVQRANLTNLIGEIRSALGDDPAAPCFIRTVSRFGYAFHAAVEPPPGASPQAPFVLLWKDGSADLAEGDHALGRAADHPISLPAPTLSRRHACIHVRGVSAELEDLGSKNGTWLNGERVVGRVPLADGDEIRLGTFRLVFRARTAAASTLSAL